MSDATDPHFDSRDPEAALPMFDFYVEQLETYLDGELDAVEAAGVRKRLTEEPAYAAALDRLHQQRQLRLDVLGQADHHEGDEVAAARLRACASRMSVAGRLGYGDAAEAGDVMTATRGVSRWWIGSAVAACMLAAFSLGLYGRLDRGTPPAEVVSNPLPPLPGNTMLITDDQGDIVVHQKIDDAPANRDRETDDIVFPRANP